jgi:hypothetical protein
MVQTITDDKKESRQAQPETALGRLLSTVETEQLKSNFPRMARKDAMGARFAQAYGVPESYMFSDKISESTIWRYANAIGGQDTPALQALREEFSKMSKQERDAIAAQIVITDKMSGRMQMLLKDVKQLVSSNSNQKTTEAPNNGDSKIQINAKSIVSEYKSAMEGGNSEALEKWEKKISMLSQKDKEDIRAGLREQIANERDFRAKQTISLLIGTYFPEK